MFVKSLRPVLLALVCATGCLAPDNQATDPKAAQPRPYVLTMCLVSDEQMAQGDPTFIYKGRTIKVCCDGCVKDFQKDPQKYLKLIDAAEQQQAAERAKLPKR